MCFAADHGRVDEQALPLLGTDPQLMYTDRHTPPFYCRALAHQSDAWLRNPGHLVVPHERLHRRAHALAKVTDPPPCRVTISSPDRGDIDGGIFLQQCA